MSTCVLEPAGQLGAPQEMISAVLLAAAGTGVHSKGVQRRTQSNESAAEGEVCEGAARAVGVAAGASHLVATVTTGVAPGCKPGWAFQKAKNAASAVCWVARTGTFAPFRARFSGSWLAQEGECTGGDTKIMRAGRHSRRQAIPPHLRRVAARTSHLLSSHKVRNRRTYSGSAEEGRCARAVTRRIGIVIVVCGVPWVNASSARGETSTWRVAVAGNDPPDIQLYGADHCTLQGAAFVYAPVRRAHWMPDGLIVWSLPSYQAAPATDVYAMLHAVACWFDHQANAVRTPRRANRLEKQRRSTRGAPSALTLDTTLTHLSAFMHPQLTPSALLWRSKKA